MRNSETKLVITIKDGTMHIDSIGFVGDACAQDALTNELKRKGNLLELKRKPRTKGRPVTDIGVIDINRS